MSRLLKASSELVKDYIHLFVNRRAYTVQSMKPHPKSGRFYYYRPAEKAIGKPICQRDVVFFGGFPRSVAEQQLDIFKRSTALQHFNRQSVPPFMGGCACLQCPQLRTAASSSLTSR